MKKLCIITLFMLPAAAYGAAHLPAQPTENSLNLEVYKSADSQAPNEGFAPPPHKRRKIEIEDNTGSTSKNKVDRIPGLGSFIIKHREKKWPPERIATAWNQQHPAQTISQPTISVWLLVHEFQQSHKNEAASPDLPQPNKDSFNDEANWSDDEADIEVVEANFMPLLLKDDNKNKVASTHPYLQTEDLFDKGDGSDDEADIELVESNKLSIGNPFNVETEDKTMGFITPEMLAALGQQDIK